MKQEHANIAERNLPQINTVTQNAALNHVPIGCCRGYPNYAKIKKIRYIGKQDVFNMEVLDHHNFSVNGGLIVHNCIDAIRYAMEQEMRSADQKDWRNIKIPIAGTM